MRKLTVKIHDKRKKTYTPKEFGAMDMNTVAPPRKMTARERDIEDLKQDAYNNGFDAARAEYLKVAKMEGDKQRKEVAELRESIEKLKRLRRRDHAQMVTDFTNAIFIMGKREGKGPNRTDDVLTADG